MNVSRIAKIAIGAGLVIGGVGVVLRLLEGHEPAGYGSYIPWGLWIAMYIYLSGLAAGAFLVASLGYVFRVQRLMPVARLALVVAFVSLPTALILAGLDLGHLERFWRVFVNGNPSSVMAWMIWFYMAFGIVLAAMVVMAFRAELVGWGSEPGWRGKLSRPLTFGRSDLSQQALAEDRKRMRAIGIVGVVLAIAFSGGLGALLGVLAARPYAHSPLMPLLFIVSGLTTAAAFVTAYVALFARERDARWRELVTLLGRITLGLLVIDLVLEWAEASIGVYGAHPEVKDAYELIMFGTYWWVFWIVHILVGAIVPLVILARRGRDPSWVAAAAGLVVVTFLAVRLNLVIPALAVPQIEGLDEAFVNARLSYDYFPSVVEWLVGIFAVSLFAALLWLAAHNLPLLGTPAAGIAGSGPLGPAPGSGTGGPASLSRRGLFAGGALLGGGLLASQTAVSKQLLGIDEAAAATIPYKLTQPDNIIYSVCQQCNTQCGIKAKLQDGTLVKIDGSPYSPWTMRPHLPLDTPLAAAANVDGWICPKGQAGIQTAYDPYRIRKVLKRDGPRGSGKWKTIAFDDAVEEIVEGGQHFAHLGEKRRVPGLRELYALKDPDASKEMADDLKKLSDEEMSAAQFRRKYRKHMKDFIDPAHPDLGPKNNQLAFVWGRMKDGRGDFVKRFVGESFGSTNAIGHTTVCQGSLYFSGKAMSEEFVEGKWDLGDKFYWQAELGGAEFVIFVGASPFEANYGPPYRSSKITEGLVDGRLKIAVVDPRLSKTASKAWKWLPIKPGAEGALALALIRWTIEHNRYNKAFLRNANRAAAEKAGEPSWTNATWLVKKDGKLLRGSDLGKDPQERPSELKPGEKWDFDPFVLMGEQGPVTFDPNDEKKPARGRLLVNEKVNGIPVKSGLQLIRESSEEHTIAEWAKICGLETKDVIELAREFTSHGSKAAADVHRGASQHSNGFYNVVAWFTLNALVGNYDHKGGMSKVATFNLSGEKRKEPIPGKPFVLTDMHPAKQTPVGMQIIRAGAKYDHSTLFDGYPAKRPWFPLSSDVYQEIWPSVGDAYPYPIKALILYMGSPVYSLPAGHKVIETLSDPDKLPLFVASDIVVGETSMYADYIFPDLSNLERWEFAGSHPNVTVKSQPIRQPVIAPLTDEVEVDGERMPLSLEAMLLGFANRLGLPGFGKDGLGEGLDLRRGEDLYMLQAANIAAGDDLGESVPDISAKDMEIFLASRGHLPKTVFDPQRWRGQVGSKWWGKVAFVLSRGGRFADPNSDYTKDLLTNTYGKQINVYMEKTAGVTDSMSGKPLSGVARYLPAATDSLGRKVEDADFPLRMITFREIMHTKSRTSGNYWLQALLPENSVVINESDARKHKLSDGDWVRVVSASNAKGQWELGNGRTRPVVGKVRTVQGMRPGVVAFSLGHGHWAYGASDVEIDGVTIKGDERRGKGLHGNASMRVDPHLKDVTISDLVGGSAVFYDSQVRLERASEEESRLI